MEYSEKTENLRQQVTDRACVLDAILKYMHEYNVGEFTYHSQLGSITFNKNLLILQESTSI